MDGEEPTTAGGVMEGAVGVVLVVLAVAAVLLLILLCWVFVWKVLLSRLGLFKALFNGPPEKKPKPILKRSGGSFTGVQRKGSIRFADLENKKKDHDDNDDDDETTSTHLVPKRTLRKRLSAPAPVTSPYGETTSSQEQVPQHPVQMQHPFPPPGPSKQLSVPAPVRSPVGGTTSSQEQVPQRLVQVQHPPGPSNQLLMQEDTEEEESGTEEEEDSSSTTLNRTVQKIVLEGSSERVGAPKEKKVVQIKLPAEDPDQKEDKGKKGEGKDKKGEDKGKKKEKKKPKKVKGQDAKKDKDEEKSKDSEVSKRK